MSDNLIDDWTRSLNPVFWEDGEIKSVYEYYTSGDWTIKQEDCPCPVCDDAHFALYLWDDGEMIGQGIYKSLNEALLAHYYINNTTHEEREADRLGEPR